MWVTRMRLVLFVLLVVGMVNETVGSVNAPSFWPFDNDGVVNPQEYYQRYRRDEYSADKPFFQWWYFYITDFSSEKFFFFLYGIDETHSNSTEQYFTAYSGMVDVNANTRWAKKEQFPIDVMQITNYRELQSTYKGENIYGMHIENNDTYVLTGDMKHPEMNVWVDGISSDTIISWNITLDRIYGWYGQQDIEKYAIKLEDGEIGWNPYAHNSLVSGSFSVGDSVFYFNHSSNFRAYGDMNFGSRFPDSGSKPDWVDYPWGWYTVTVPNTDPDLDTSIVVGCGTAEQPFPIGKSFGLFGDFRFNSSSRLGIRQVLGWDGSKYKLDLLSTSSDGKLLSAGVNRTCWTDYMDEAKNYTIPLCQTVWIKTTHYNITLEYTTDISKVNILPFSYGENMFSDLEALGATVHAIVFYIDDNGDSSLIYDIWSYSAGVEFGYRTAETPRSYEEIEIIDYFKL